MSASIRRFNSLLPLAAPLALGASALAQNAPPPAAAEPPDTAVFKATPGKWRYEFNTWAWMMGLDGDIGARGQTASIDASFVDIVDKSDSIAALSGRLELGCGAIAGYIDGLYADLSVDDATGPLGLADVDIDFQQVIVDFGIMYRVGDWEPSGDAANNPRNLTLDLYAGGHYMGLEVDLSPALAPAVSGSEDWLDPIVGAKTVIPIAERWHLAVNADVGGFGAASDLTWSTTAVVGYGFHLFDHPASVMLGYRAMSWDYTNGSGANEFTWDLIQHGAILGFSLHF